MSHEATNWAILQRGLKPATKIVLWWLCDRYNKDYGGSFPSQNKLANDCEMTRSTVNLHLKELETRGLIRRERRWNKQTKHQETTRYRLAFEEGFEPAVPETPCPEIGHGKQAEPVSEKEPDPCPKKAETRVRNSDTNPVREPVREPVSERERAREDLEVETADPEPTATPATWLARFKRAYSSWPTYVTDNDDKAKKLWFELSEAERLAALEGIEAYQAIERGRKNKTGFPTYLQGKRWLKLPAKARAQGGASQTQVVKPFGKMWGAKRFSKLMAPPGYVDRKINSFQQLEIDSGKTTLEAVLLGRQALSGWPGVKTMHERAIDQHKGDTVSTALEPLACLFAPINVGSVLWRAWADMHRKKGWPWIEGPRLPEWVYMPKPPDDGEGDADAAVRQALSEFERAHAALTMGDTGREAAE